MNRGRGWMGPLILVLLVAAPILEIWTLIQIGGWIGFWPTLLVVLVLTGVGGWLVAHQGRKSWQALTAALQEGKDPGKELTDAVLVLLGGILLLIPGFITDVVSLVFLLPFTRALPRLWLQRLTRNRMGGMARYPGMGRGTVIEGETVEESYGSSGPSRPGDESNDDIIIEGEIEPPER